MDPDKLQRLRKNHINLKRDLDTLTVLDHLYEKAVFTDYQCELVRVKKTQEERSQELLTILKRTGNRGYETFLQILENLQPHLAEALVHTSIDREILGEQLTENIFYNPSDDFELKGLIDQLTKDDRITQQQLQRMKLYITGEIGCSENVTRTKNSPQSLFLHLMDVKLLTRFNLAFLQSLLWKVDLRDLCQDVATFARKSDKQPIFFFSSQAIENGFVPCELHVQGNIANFNGLTIEEICFRISRYAGLPRALVVPAGIKPSNSMILTVWIPENSLEYFETKDVSWLAELGIDYIIINDKRITLKAGPERGDSSHDEKLVLERELRKKMEHEKHLKQCLYDEQIGNESLREMLDQQELKFRSKQENLNRQCRLNSNLFCALMTALHLVYQLLRYNISKTAREPFDLRERSARAYFKDVVRRAKRVCNPESLQEVIDAHAIVKDLMFGRQIRYLMQGYSGTVERLQAYCRDATLYKAVVEELGARPTQLPPQPTTAEIKVSVKGITTYELTPELDRIVVDMANKLTAKQADKLVKHYKLHEDLKLESYKHSVFRQILVQEALRTRNLSDEGVDRLMEEATTKVIRRRELWEEFKAQNKKRRQSHVANLPDITGRLDNIEKILKHIVAQNHALPFVGGIPFQTEAFKMPVFPKGNQYCPL